MSRKQFLAELRAALRGVPATEVEDILADYRAHFEEAGAAGRSEQDVADALGQPTQLAKELRAEAGLRRWEEHRTPANLIAAVVALAGLAAIDLIVLLPLLFVVGLIVFVTGVVIFALIVAGIATLASPLWVRPFDGVHAVSIILSGVGLTAGGIGCSALMVLAVEGVLKVLGRYARLHYQVIKPA